MSLSEYRSHAPMLLLALAITVQAFSFAFSAASADERLDANAPTASAPTESAVIEDAMTNSSSVATSPQQTSRTAAAFTLKLTRVFTPAGGSPLRRSTTERHQRADGTFLLVTTHFDSEGAVRGMETRIGMPGRGIFRADERRRVLELIAPLSEEEVAEDAASLLGEDPRYVREESVSGYRTIVLRDPKGTAEEYTEWYHAPELNGVFLKSVTSTRGGVEVTEPTEITTESPDQRLFGALQGYAVDSVSYERRIKKLEARGQGALATGMREHVRRAKQP